MDGNYDYGRERGFCYNKIRNLDVKSRAHRAFGGGFGAEAFMRTERFRRS